MLRVIEINLTLHAHTPDAALAAWETLTRAAAGFGFDGIHAEISIDRINVRDDDDDESRAERTSDDPP